MRTYIYIHTQHTHQSSRNSFIKSTSEKITNPIYIYLSFVLFVWQLIWYEPTYSLPHKAKTHIIFDWYCFTILKLCVNLWRSVFASLIKFSLDFLSFAVSSFEAVRAWVEDAASRINVASFALSAGQRSTNLAIVSTRFSALKEGPRGTKKERKRGREKGRKMRREISERLYKILPPITTD